MAQGFRHAVGERLVERHRQADIAEEGFAGHILTFAWAAAGATIVRRALKFCLIGALALVTCVVTFFFYYMYRCQIGGDPHWMCL